MKKQIIALSLAGILSCAYAQAADIKLEWNDAKEKITTKAQNVVDNYKETCPISVPMYEALLSKDFDEAWDIVKDSLSYIESLEIYKKAIENPHDDILWAELSIQVGSYIGAQAGSRAKNDVAKGFQYGMKAGGICGAYLELLRNELKK